MPISSRFQIPALSYFVEGEFIVAPIIQLRREHDEPESARCGSFEYEFSNYFRTTESPRVNDARGEGWIPGRSSLALRLTNSMLGFPTVVL